MIAAGKIVRALGSSVFPASFFVRKRLFQNLPFSRIPLGRRTILVVLSALAGLAAVCGLIFQSASLPSRSAAETFLLSLSLEERIAYADGIDSLIRESPESLTRLVGLDLILLLDKPAYARQEGSVIVWQYRTADCVLDLYVDTTRAPDAQPISSPVVYQEIRDRRRGTSLTSTPGSRIAPLPLAAQQSCLANLLEAAHAGRIDRLLLSESASEI
ncbi:MAG TPA: hypothetical protein PKX87_02770 [Alphaproteobacteria bacterium]|nr:hypothetical protein [Alphaproteobacteria bacterium]